MFLFWSLSLPLFLSLPLCSNDIWFHVCSCRSLSSHVHFSFYHSLSVSTLEVSEEPTLLSCHFLMLWTSFVFVFLSVLKWKLQHLALNLYTGRRLRPLGERDDGPPSVGCSSRVIALSLSCLTRLWKREAGKLHLRWVSCYYVVSLLKPESSVIWCWGCCFSKPTNFIFIF